MEKKDLNIGFNRDTLEVDEAYNSVETERLQNKMSQLDKKLDRFNLQIKEGKKKSGQIVTTIIKDLESQKTDLASTLYLLSGLQSEDQPMHPNVAEILSTINPNTMVEDDIKTDIILGGTGSVDQKLSSAIRYGLLAGMDSKRVYDDAWQPEIFGIYGIDLKEELKDQIKSNPEKILDLIKLQIKSASDRSDNLNQLNFFPKETADQFLDLFKGDKKDLTFWALAYLGAYSLTVGSKNVPCVSIFQKDVNFAEEISKFENLDELFQSDFWKKLLASVPVTTSGHGRSNFTIPDGVLESIPDKQINVLHIGGGPHEVIDISQRLKALGKDANQIDVNMYSQKELNKISNEYSYSVGKSLSGQSTLANSLSKNVANNLGYKEVLHDLNQPDLTRILVGEANEEWGHDFINSNSGFDLIISANSILPHVSNIGKLATFEELDHVLGENGVLILVGGYVEESKVFYGAQIRYMGNGKYKFESVKLHNGVKNRPTTFETFERKDFDKMKTFEPFRRSNLYQKLN